MLRNTYCLREHGIEKSKICSGHVDVRCRGSNWDGALRLGLSRRVLSLSTPECPLSLYAALRNTSRAAFLLPGLHIGPFILSCLSLSSILTFFQIPPGVPGLPAVFLSLLAHVSLLQPPLPGSAVCSSAAGCVVSMWLRTPSPHYHSCPRLLQAAVSCLLDHLGPGIIPEKCGHLTNYLVDINHWAVWLHIVLNAQKINI